MSHAATATPLGALWGALFASRARSARTAPPPAPRRPNPGPVLMADIHTRWGGQPSLLLLWAEWEEAQRPRD